MGVDERREPATSQTIPATLSSADLQRIAVERHVNSDTSVDVSFLCLCSFNCKHSKLLLLQEDEAALISKVVNLCERGGNGVAAAAVRMEVRQLADIQHLNQSK